MKRHLVMAAGLSILSALPAATIAAQSPSCPSGATQDACQMATDMFQYMAPQLGIAVTGGNTTLGQGGTLGGLGHFSVGVRGNVIKGDLPDLSKFPSPSYNGAQQHDLPTSSRPVGLPSADAAIGLFQGIPLGLTNILGVDGLLNASYVPTVSRSNLSVKPSSNLQLGYGVRLGLLQESLLVPGVSFSYLRRDLPKVDITGTASNSSGTSDTLAVQGLQENTSAWRIVASKSLLLFGLAAGVGQDKYDLATSIHANVDPGLLAGGRQQSTISASQSMTRTNVFADFSFNFVVGKLVAEVGQVSGGKVPTYNTFSGGAADKSRLYGSVGLRVGF